MDNQTATTSTTTTNNQENQEEKEKEKEKKERPSKWQVTIHHFKLGPVIGHGAFSTVNLVFKKDTQALFALKSTPKEQCIRQKNYQSVLRERSILECLHHQFIVNLKYAFQDRDYMYLVLDLMLGRDLRFHLHLQKTFPEPTVYFFAAELSSALIYLHRHRVVHRDIKPENILLDELGHLHVTDFNCAIVISHGEKLKKIVGTHGYIAPEVYGTEGYSEEVDWWSLGIVLWECLHGMRPFDASNKEQLAIKLQSSPILYSPHISWPMRLFLEGLLERSPSARLGSGSRGRDHVTSHLVFRTMHWSQLDAKHLLPPYTPPAICVAEMLETTLTPSSSASSSLSAEQTTTRARFEHTEAGRRHPWAFVASRFKYFDHTSATRRGSARRIAPVTPPCASRSTSVASGGGDASSVVSWWQTEERGGGCMGAPMGAWWGAVRRWVRRSKLTWSVRRRRKDKCRMS